MKYKVIAFDWDGTLVDSTGRIVDSMHLAAKTCGLPVLSDQDVRQIIGLGLPEALRRLWPDASVHQYEKMALEYSRNFSAVSQVEATLYSGAIELLESLRGSGLSLVVATGKSRRGLEEMFDSLNLRHFFSSSRCADETLSKPDPLMLEELLKEFNIAPDQMLMVGDTSFDLDMARALDMDSIGMTHGAHSPQILRDSAPLALCDSLNELKNWIVANG